MVKVLIVAAAAISAGTAGGGYFANAPLPPQEKAQKLESVVCYSPKSVKELNGDSERLSLTIQITWNVLKGNCVYLASKDSFVRTSNMMDPFSSVGENFAVIETGRLKSNPGTVYRYDEIPLSTD